MMAARDHQIAHSCVQPLVAFEAFSKCTAQGNGHALWQKLIQSKMPVAWPSQPRMDPHHASSCGYPCRMGRRNASWSMPRSGDVQDDIRSIYPPSRAPAPIKSKDDPSTMRRADQWVSHIVIHLQGAIQKQVRVFFSLAYLKAGTYGRG